MGKQRLILYVEDNLDHAELVMRGLSMFPDIGTVHLTDGDETVAYLNDAENTLPDLVLLDLRLPKRDGVEVLDAIRASASLVTVPVVILSTSNADPDIKRAYNSRANSYIVKPTDFTALTRVVQELATYWTTWNVVPR